jgi:hypothetical protein
MSKNVDSGSKIFQSERYAVGGEQRRGGIINEVEQGACLQMAN